MDTVQEGEKPYWRRRQLAVDGFAHLAMHKLGGCGSMGIYHCDPSDHLPESPGPRARNPKRIPERSSRPPGLECQNSLEKARKVSQKCRKLRFLDFFDLFETFLRLRARKTFWRLFWDFGPGWPGHSCKWSLELQIYHQISFSGYIQTLPSCAAADLKKIAPGSENCVEVVCRTLPGDSQRNGEMCVRAPMLAQ